MTDDELIAAAGRVCVAVSTGGDVSPVLVDARAVAVELVRRATDPVEIRRTAERLRKRSYRERVPDNPGTMSRTNGGQSPGHRPGQSPENVPDRPPSALPPSAAASKTLRKDSENGVAEAAAVAASSSARVAESSRTNAGQCPTLPGVLAGVLDGVDGASTSRKNLLRLERCEPLLRRLASEQGVEPVALFEAGWRRFKADDDVKRQRYGAAVFLSQLEQWCWPDPTPERTPGEIRAQQSAVDLERMKREQADERDVPTAAEIRELTAGIGRRVAS